MILNIEKALELAKLLNPFISETLNEDENILDFVGKIIHEIKESQTPEVFGESLILMNNLSEEDVLSLTGEKSVGLFIKGLRENKILSLVEFFRWLMS